MEILEHLLDDLEGKVLLFALSACVTLLVLPLIGCSTTAVGEPKIGSMEGRFEVERLYGDMTVITDTEEGCQYLYYKYGYGGGFIQLTDKYGNPLLANGYSRREVGMSDDGE